jgi:predicted nucleic acid-binding protein
MSAEHIFVDTNILVYAHDADAGARHAAAVEKISAFWDAAYPPAISTQVIQELYATLSRKGADPKECRRIVSIYFDWEIIDHDPTLIVLGMDLSERFKINWWDSLIVAAAYRAKASILWTEDFQEGQRFDFLTVQNPFNLSS